MVENVYHGADDEERINQCLNCPYPEKLCHGEKSCKALERYTRAKAKSVRYADD